MLIRLTSNFQSSCLKFFECWDCILYQHAFFIFSFYDINSLTSCLISNEGTSNLGEECVSNFFMILFSKT